MKRTSTKSALLASVVSLVLCVSMLVGTTFAWFTDTESSGTTNIVAGSLDIGLYHQNNVDAYEEVTGNVNLFDDVAYWEPGVSVFENLTVKNEGELALKYDLSVLIENVTVVDGTSFAEVLEYAVVKDGAIASKEAALALEYKPLTDFALSGELLPGRSAEYGIVIRWNQSDIDDLFNMNDDKKGIPVGFDVSVKLTAVQLSYESDAFGDNQYDADAYNTVSSVEELRIAINDSAKGEAIFIEAGEYQVNGVITIDGKDITLVGLGAVNFVKIGGSHIFNVANSSNVTFKNVDMDGKGLGREGVYVRNNSTVTLENCVIKNTGGKDIMVDEASDATHGLETYSVVNLVNSSVEDVAFCASPVTTVPSATQDTYVYFNYDSGSTVGSIEKQSINIKPENIYINGDPNDGLGTTMYLNVTNDRELAAALETVSTDSRYWNNTVIINMAAGEYSGDYVLNQYPGWNGVVGGGSTANNYATGVAGEAFTNVIFVGESISTYARTSVPTVVFTGNVTVNGFGNAGTGFVTAVATTTFKNVAFDGSNSAESNGEDTIVMSVKAGANNVTFDECVFTNATHVILGGASADAVGKVTVNGCVFDNGGCLSGYFETLEVKDTDVLSADNGFINKSKSGKVTVSGGSVNAGKYFIRTSNSGVELAVENCDIEMYESEGTAHLVYFRGKNESADFTDCTIADGYTQAGVDSDSELGIINYSEVEGATYYKDGVTGETVLYVVPEDYTETTFEVAEGTTVIGGYAFAYNTAIETIILPTTVTTLNDRAFRDTSASTVVLNEGLENISYQAFRNALNVTSVEIPSTVKTISKEAFQNSGIKELIVPENVTTIEYGAMRDMGKLETVTLKGDVDIPVYAFRNCTNLKTVIIEGTNVTFGGGSRGMIFTNKENGDGSAITITVANEDIKARLLAADTAAKDYGGYTINCVEEKPENEDYYVDEDGVAYGYDADALIGALEDGKDFCLMVDTKIDPAGMSNAYGTTGINVKNGQTVDGNGKILDIKGAGGTWDSGINTTGGLIKNITVTGSFRGIFINHNSDHSEKVILENVIIDGTTYTISCDQASGQGLEATDSTFNGWTSYAATLGEAKFVNCNFGEGNGYAYCRPYAPTEFVNCNFEAGFRIDARAAITLENCYLDGVLITADNVATLVTSNTANATVK